VSDLICSDGGGITVDGETASFTTNEDRPNCVKAAPCSLSRVERKLASRVSGITRLPYCRVLEVSILMPVRLLW